MVNKALKDFQAEVTREAGYIMKKGARYVTGEANISVRSTSKNMVQFYLPAWCLRKNLLFFKAVQASTWR
jgi:hypothetical protein